MASETPATQASSPHHSSEESPVTGNVNTGDGALTARDQTMQGDGVYGDKVTGDRISAEIGAGAQNVVVGTGNTQIIGYSAEQVAVIIAQIRRADQPQGWNGRTPYIGLASFREQQANLFFGREKLVAHLLACVAESRLLCIAGPSGSGKSSLVQAGLIPALRAGKIAGSEQWLLETVTPGNQPLENLALALGRMAKSPAAAAYLRSHGAIDSSTLHAQVETLLSHHRDQRALLVVDEFEEIFTQSKEEAVRLPFLDLLTYAAQQADGRVSVVLVMRSDFVSQCAAYPELRKLISGQLELVGAMEPEELARAIALPALEVGVEVKHDLAAQVIADMRGEPGALPLMQFALKDLFDAQAKQPGDQVVLTLEAYLARGGIQSALERHANAQFAVFSAEEQAIARKIFMSLIEVGRGTVDTRRTAAFAELLPAGANPDQVEKVVQTLAGARLITTDNLPPAVAQDDILRHNWRPAVAQDDILRHNWQIRTITIAHEKLIEAWPWLQQLVRENRALIELQNQISEDAAQWVAHGRDSSYLYTGARLQTAQEQLAANQLVLSAVAQQLVEASAQAEAERLQQIEDERQRELEQERLLAEAQRLRAEEQTQAAQRLRRRNQGLGLALAGALLLALVAFLFFQRANTAQQQEMFARQTAVAEQVRANQKAQEAQEAADARATEVVSRTIAQVEAEAARDEAQQQARRAKAGELAASAQSELAKSIPDPSLALLLAIEAVTITQPAGGLVFANANAALDAALQNAPPWRRSLASHEEWIGSAVFSADGKTVVTASSDGTARVWEAASGRPLHTLSGHEDLVYSAVFSPDGKFIVTASYDGTARVWEAASGRPLHALTGHTEPVNSAVFSPDGKSIVTASWDGTARVWAVASGQPLLTLTGHEDLVESAMFSPDGETIVTASYDGTARVWRVASGQPLLTLTGHEDLVHSAVFSPDGKFIVTASYDGTARVWAVASGQPVHTLAGHEGVVSSAVFGPDSKSIVTTSQDGTARVWAVASGQPLLTLTGHEDLVYSAVFSPDGETIVTASRDNTARVWAVASGQPLHTLSGHTGPVNSAVFSPDSKSIVTAGDDNTARVWEVTSGQPVHTLAGHEEWVNSAAFSPDGQTIVTASGDHTARVWGVASGRTVHTLSGHEDWVTSAVFSPDGKTIVTASDDSTARVWAVASGQPVHTLTGHEGSVTSAVFSPDGKYIVTASDDDTARVWEVANGQPVHTLSGHEGSVNSAVFSPDSKYIVTASDDTARVWEVASGQPVHILTGHAEWVTSAAFSPDGKFIVTASSDKTARTWFARLDDAVEAAKGLVQRDPPDFTPAERERFGLD